MSRTRDLFERLGVHRPGLPPEPDPLPPGGGQAIGASDLRARRDELARELAELQWDLGGMAYEMAIRDHFRVEVLTKQAALVQAADARLGEVEHLLALDEAGAAGACPSCGALYARGAQFCARCGTQLLRVEGAAEASIATHDPVLGAEAPAHHDPAAARHGAAAADPSSRRAAEPEEDAAR